LGNKAQARKQTTIIQVLNH